MTDNEIISAAAETIIDKPKFTFTIPITWRPEVKRTLPDKLLRKPLPEPETERTFTIYPCKVCNMYRIASVAARIPQEIKSGTLSEACLPLIYAHMKDIVYVIASAIQNNPLEPDPELITFINNNFDAIDLHSSLQPALQNLNMEAFFNSIVLIKGTVKILQPKEEKTSPKDGSELIASHTAS